MDTNGPKLTFSDDVREFIRETYSEARCILEYGSGGSTILAAEMADKIIFSVESDREWAKNLCTYIDSSEAILSVPEVRYVDIGPTKAWGHPIDSTCWRQFYRYPMDIWDMEGFVHPDVVLIDGRFRVACFYTSLLRSTRRMVILFDDYVDRGNYHRVEKIMEPTRIVDRMAVFETRPMEISRDILAEFVGSFSSTA